MTKYIIVISSQFILSLSTFAQTEKPCLFIGLYNNSNATCSDRNWVREEVLDRAEFNQRSTQFITEHLYGVSSKFVSENQCVIVCEFSTNKSAFSCYPRGILAFIGSTMEDCKRQMEQDTKLFVKNRSVQSKIIYERQSVGSQK